MSEAKDGNLPEVRQALHFGYDKQSENNKYLHNKLNKLKNQPVKMITNVYKKMDFDKDISSFKFIEETKMMKNHNIFLKNLKT